MEQYCACSYPNGASSQEVATTSFAALLFDISVLFLANVKRFRWLSEAGESQSCYDLYVGVTLARIDGCVLAAAFQKKNDFSY